MPSTDKYCVDCALFQPSPTGAKYGRCGHQTAVKPPNADRFLSPELDARDPNQFAFIQRDHGPCGHDATLFVAKLVTEQEAAE
jgi:hypothetical protein